PSDSQAATVLTDIVKAENAIAIASAHISHLQAALKRLVQQCEELQTFVKTHRAVLSILRLLPDEILLEIFQHCLAPHDARATAPWVVSHVCRRWRAVALSSPQLWRHFVFHN
ncbi:hypothetical protein C8R46DRAFT_860900, partial [Mycena filopes]